MAVTMKNADFWDVTPCGSYKNRCFRRTYRLYHQGYKNRRARYKVSSNSQPKHAAKIVFLCSVLQLLVTANFVPTSPIPLSLMIEAVHSADTFVLTRATRRHTPEDAGLQLNPYLFSANITVQKLITKLPRLKI
jgi:hypothetical protein